MKKNLILLLTVLFFITGACSQAESLQQKDEILTRGIVNSPIGRLSRHHASLKIDYIGYKLNSGESVYSQILELESKYADISLPNQKVNLEYIRKLKEFYLFIAGYSDKNCMSAAFLKEFNEHKIVIPDEQYVLLDEDLKVLLAVVNVFN